MSSTRWLCPGLSVGLGKGAEPLWRFPSGLRPVGGRDIDLADALAGALADIADREADLDRLAVGLRREVRQGEARVAEAVAEPEQRLVALHVIPFVPDRSAFVVEDFGRRSVGLAEAGNVRARELVGRRRES